MDSGDLLSEVQLGTVCRIHLGTRSEQGHRFLLLREKTWLLMVSHSLPIHVHLTFVLARRTPSLVFTWKHHYTVTLDFVLKPWPSSILTLITLNTNVGANTVFLQSNCCVYGHILAGCVWESKLLVKLKKNWCPYLLYSLGSKVFPQKGRHCGQNWIFLHLDNSYIIYL